MTEKAQEYFEFYESMEILETHLPPKLAALRQKLSQKAKKEKRFRFYSLFVHICAHETLLAAWKHVRANNGSSGVDEVSIKEIEQQEGGVESYLRDIEQSLRDKTYRADPVRRAYLLKENGKLRPLGIPTVRDRIVQTAVLLILEPIFEADFEECSHGFRPGRSAHDALKVIGDYLKQGFSGVYDADLQGYFDSIPHDKLIACLRMRVVDSSVLKLIRLWLKAPVVEESSVKGGKPSVKRNTKGTPQGGVISPLLSNIYLHWFDKVFHLSNGPCKWANAKLVRYADDFVVLARYISPQLQGFIEDKIENWLCLEINREKTKVFDAKTQGQTLDFLGYSFRYDRDRFGRSFKYWNLFPSPGSLQRERDKLKEMTDARQCFKPLPKLIGELNTHLRGWANYFGAGYPRQAFRSINRFTRQRLTRHAKRRSQRGYRIPKGKSFYSHFADLDLCYL